MAVEVSPEDKKYAQTLLAQRKEEQFYLGALQKGDKKKDVKVILVTQHRVYVIKAGEHKIYKDANLLDLVEIRSPNNNEIALVFKSFEVDGATPRADDIITNIRQAYEFSFYGTPEDARIKLNVQPSSRIIELAIKELPLGGFVNTYKAMSDFYGHPPREEICWDMEHTYSTKNIKTFDLSEFEQPLHPHDIRSLLTSLRYNIHFTSLVICDIPFNKDQVTVLADTLKTNAAIETLKLVNIGARAEAITSICSALSANKNIAVTELDISNNPIEDKGITAVANFIGSTPRGIVRLDISNTSLGKVGTAAIGAALKKNVKTSATLFYLALDGNKLEAEGSSSLASYLATPNSLRSLHIASTIPSLETIIGAVVRGCQELRHINVSDNKMTKKDATLLTRFISASASLKQLTLNRTAIPADALKEILLSIGGNVYLQDFILEAKANELGITGAQAVAEAVPKLTNVHTLDLDDNDFGDDGISAIAEGLCNNSYLKRLDISRNFKIAKSKPRGAMLESITNLFSSDCPLEALILAGGPKSQLKGELVSLIYDLATNDSLLELDVSGQAMGNRGAVALGKTLQTNNTLNTLTWDDNQTTLSGFQSFKTGMDRNHSIKVMTLPILDIANAIRTDPPHKVQQVISDMEKALSRNQSPGRQYEAHKSSALGSFSVLTSGQQQNIDKLIMKIKSTGHRVDDQDDQNVIQDAGSTEKFVAGLHLMREATYQLAEEEMQSRLKAFAEQASIVLRQKKGELVNQILKTLQDNFTSLDQQTLRRLHTGIEFGSKDLNQEELETILVKATGAELSSKANETFLSCVEIASDYVYEKMETRLNEIYQDLDVQRPAPSPSTPHQETQSLSPTPSSESISSSTPPASPAPVRAPPTTPAPTQPVQPAQAQPPTQPPTQPAAQPAQPAQPVQPFQPAQPSPPVSTTPPSQPPPAAPTAGATATPAPKPTPPKTAPRVIGSAAGPSAAGSGSSSPATSSVAGRVAAVSGNAAVAAAIARGVAGPPSPGLRPPIRPPRESTSFTQSQVEKEDSKGDVSEPPVSPKGSEPVLKKEDSKVTKEDLKKEKERKEKEEKERKEREKREKEEKEKKEKERAKAEKEKKDKEKKDKEKNAKVKDAKKDVKSPKIGGGVPSSSTGVDIPVQDKPKEQELVHLTRERPKVPGGGRKPPTRRPRPPTAEEAASS